MLRTRWIVEAITFLLSERKVYKQFGVSCMYCSTLDYKAQSAVCVMFPYTGNKVAGESCNRPLPNDLYELDPSFNALSSRRFLAPLQLHLFTHAVPKLHGFFTSSPSSLFHWPCFGLHMANIGGGVISCAHFRHSSPASGRLLSKSSLRRDS
jgi:hypothetical protein